MSTLAILPVKSFAEAKQRLAPELSPGARRALAESMFSDVLVALRRAHAVDEILVVSGDNAAQQIAGGYGAQVLDDLGEGHSAAATLGVGWALDADIDRALLVPGDCPMLVPAEIDELCAHPAVAPSALIVPDRHGTGTNALLLTPPDALAPSFGPDSCQRHAAHAEKSAITYDIVEMPSLALDVDTFEDLSALHSALAGSHGGAAHTRGMLRQLTRSSAR